MSFQGNGRAPMRAGIMFSNRVGMTRRQRAALGVHVGDTVHVHGGVTDYGHRFRPMVAVVALARGADMDRHEAGTVRASDLGRHHLRDRLGHFIPLSCVRGAP